MWDFLSKNCGIFSSKGGTKIWDFRQQGGGDFCSSGFGHTVNVKNPYEKRPHTVGPALRSALRAALRAELAS